MLKTMEDGVAKSESRTINTNNDDDSIAPKSTLHADTIKASSTVVTVTENEDDATTNVSIDPLIQERSNTLNRDNAQEPSQDQVETEPSNNSQTPTKSDPTTTSSSSTPLIKSALSTPQGSNDKSKPILERNVSFSLQHEVREFRKTNEEIAFEREEAELSYQLLLQRWRGKGKKKDEENAQEQNQQDEEDEEEDFDPKKQKMPDCREIRIITLHRGKELRPLGLDLSIKPAVKPETGTIATIRGMNRAGLATQETGQKHRLRVGDQILKVWDSNMSDAEPGQFLAMLASPTLELVVFSPADARAKQERIRVEREQIEIERFENRRKLEQLKREKANAQLQQDKVEEKMMQDWINNYKATLNGPTTSLSNKGSDSIFRTVYLDRRVDKSAKVSDEVNAAEYFQVQPKEKLLSLGISMFVRTNINPDTRKPGGTFAVISDVHTGGLAARSGRGRNQLWSEDRVLRVQGRELTTIDPQQLVKLMNVNRLEVVVVNVAQFEALTRTPDLMDDIGNSIDAISNKLESFANSLKDRWVSGKNKDSEKNVFGVMDDLAPKKPNLDLFYVPAPVVHGSSDIISGRNWCRLWETLPNRIQFKEARCAFNTAVDGYSLHQLYNKTMDTSPFFLVFETKQRESFGVYMTAPLAESGRTQQSQEYRGTGESFLFKLAPEFKKYSWSGITHPGTEASAPKMFLHTTAERMAIGGGGSGHAIQLDDDLHFGHTYPSTTYDNEQLCTTTDFECIGLEFWGFSENMNL